MFIEYLLSNFEMLVFISILLIVIGFLLLFLYQKRQFDLFKSYIIDYSNILNETNSEVKNHLAEMIKVLDQQKNQITKLSDRMAFIEREINRLGSIKGSEDILGNAIDMARKGETKESIKNKTGLRDDEIEAIYTYYRK